MQQKGRISNKFRNISTQNKLDTFYLRALMNKKKICQI